MSADRYTDTHTHTHIRQLMSYELVYTSIHSSIIGTIYKPPRANNTQFISSLKEIFLHPTTNQYDIILMGDYNINCRARTSDQIKFENLLANFSK